MNTKLLIASASLLISASATAMDISVNGFGSIVIGRTVDDSPLYNYDNDLDFKPDTILGVQANIDLDEEIEGLTFTTQVVSSGEEDFDPDLTMAFASYALTNNFTINLGRQRVPFYRFSDFVDVGYAYGWIRPPESVYGLDISHYDGLSLRYNSMLGSYNSSIQVIVAGQYDDDLAVLGSEIDTKIKNIVGINWNLSRDWFNFRVAYLTGDLSMDIPDIQSLAPAFQAFGLSSIYDDLIVDDDKGEFFGTGFDFNFDKIFSHIEFIQFTTGDNFLPETTAYYIALGYNFTDTLSVMVTHENDKSEGDDTASEIPLNIGGNPVLIPVNGNFVPLQSVVSSATPGDSKYRTNSITLRYDFHESAALKFDISNRNNYSCQAGDECDSDATLVSLGVDFTF